MISGTIRFPPLERCGSPLAKLARWPPAMESRFWLPPERVLARSATSRSMKMSKTQSPFMMLLLGAAVITAIANWPLANRSESLVHGMTAHGTEKKTLITVPLDAGMEAVVALDHVSGEMTGYVLDRFNGKFFIQYRYNVANDFRLRPGKVPRFLMAAGQANFRQFTGNDRIADGVVYVAEEFSGQVVAYGIPWNTQFRASTTPPQSRRFIPLDLAKTRFVEVVE